MKGDFSRSTFDRKKHYSRVLMQQGRVQLDADWNEQRDIETHLQRTWAKDTLGASGTPKHDSGFEVRVTDDGQDLILSPGRIYVDGQLCENEPGKAVTYLTQPDYPASPPERPDIPGARLPDKPGTYLAYLDVWERHIAPLEDEALREVALGGPETATRTQVVWQLKLQRVGELGETITFGPGWKPATVETTGAMAAWAEPGATPDNCFYRVEIHDGSDDPNGNGPSFKWSRDNGSVVARISDIADHVITVSLNGRLPETAFAPGQWVELSDERRELCGEPGVFVQLKDVRGDTLILPESFTMPVLGPRRTVRRWDALDDVSRIEIQPPDDSQSFSLEHHLWVKFTAGTYRSGDYWVFPSRALTRNVEWPRNGSDPLFQPPHGVEHRYCRLARVEYVEYREGNTVKRKFERTENYRFIIKSLADLKELELNVVQADLHAPDGSIHVDGHGKVRLRAGTAIDQFSTDPTLKDNSDTEVPTEKAVKTYVDTAAAAVVPPGCCILGESPTAPPGYSYTGLSIPGSSSRLEWTTKANMLTPRSSLATGVVNGRIYAIGGFASFVGANYSDLTEEYDPLTNTWASRASMPTPRLGLAIGVVNGKIYECVTPNIL